jgi:hypothetical protein
MSDDDKSPQELPESTPWAEFLASKPPGSKAVLPDAIEYSAPVSAWALRVPDLQLHCENDACGGRRTFTSPISGPTFAAEEHQNLFLEYTCRNCEKRTRLFALIVLHSKSRGVVVGIKLGEFPSFGPRVPNRLLRLLGEDAEVFLKGRRCENQGLGIGAFSYYRRVIENQWKELVAELIRAAKATNAEQSVVTQLESARKQTQFKQAVETVKAAIPNHLLVNGHNPLVLIHGALSDGLHNKSDESCLEMAHSVRLVLSDFSLKMAAALKDQSDLQDAVSQLLNASRGK